MKNKKVLTVSAEDLRWTLSPELLQFDSTDKLEAQDVIIGQKKGVDAFQMGMDICAKGYNIFVTGAAGLGKLAMVRRLLENRTPQEATPDDICYVNNFSNSDEPRLLTFSAGQGKKFKDAIHAFLENIKKEIPQIFESQEYLQSKNEIIEAHDKKTRDFFKNLEARVRDAGFVLVNMQMGQVQRPDIVPLVDGEPVHLMKVEELVDKGRFPQEEYEVLSSKYQELKSDIDSIFLEVRQLQKEVKKKSGEVDRLIFRNMAMELVQPLYDAFSHKKVHAHLDAMLEDMTEHFDAIRTLGQPVQEMPGMGAAGLAADALMHPYQVNLLVDNAEKKGSPVIVESYPTYRNLFGGIDRVMDQGGMWRTDFSKITAGSFIKANGGYLVLNLMDAIMEPGVWKTLKRALKTSQIEIQTFDPWYFITTSGLKPEPVNMNVKVVVLATPQLYHMLRHYDPDVVKIFKIRADFDSSMALSDEALLEIAKLMKKFAAAQNLLPFDRTAVARLLEEGVRYAGRREKISTSFPILRDIMEESCHIARLAEDSLITAQHVEEALQARRNQANLIEEKLQEMTERGSIFIDTEGTVVGQVNGLAVYSMGDYMFGRPSRITANTSMGREGIINIERESELSGAIHNKGMLILSGYLRRNFAQNKPLSLTASIAFEQSYGGVDGDSASSTELYALFSSLSDVPIKQGIAVTGSVNQRGEVQPIGGVNEKIEGFFACCQQKGLTGEQGVLIPKANVKDLMLQKHVVEAVESGKFYVWAVEHVDQGIEILTGVPAGARNASGVYPKGTINRLVDDRLTVLAEGLRDFGKKKSSAQRRTRAKNTSTS